MPTRWETFPIKLEGGMVTNLPKLQHGLELPGAPRILRNFEPSLKGGYRRVNGFTKYNENVLSAYGDVRVQGSGQTGTSLSVANIFSEPKVGDVITIAGVTGTYTVNAVSFTDADNAATLTLDASLASSPVDKASVTFDSNTNLVTGLWTGRLGDSRAVIAVRGGVVYEDNSGWQKINTPNYGSVLVKGPSQTGSSLDIDGIASDDYVPAVGDTFTIDGIELVYTVTGVGTVSAGAETINISPALDTSPADNAVITFLNTKVCSGNKVRFDKFNFSGTDKVVLVDCDNYPATFDGTTYTVLSSTVDIKGATFVSEFKNHLFFAKDDVVTFSAPFAEDDFNTGNGAGNFRLPSKVTGMIVFRERLIIFTESSIHQLSGSSVSDFQLSSVSNSLGCIQPDTIQEVGGDVLYMGPDGIRYLGATERIGDFNLALASRNIQSNMEEFITDWTTYQAVLIRNKSQYRVFGYSTGVQNNNTIGYLGTQFMDQNSASVAWAELKGFPVYVSASSYVDGVEKVYFANSTGYVYEMESGNSLDGTEIRAKLATPHLSINDPSFRKTFYTLRTFYTPEGNVDGTVGLVLDINDINKIQPSTISFSQIGSFSVYGEAIYSTSSYGGTPRYFDRSQLVGAGFQGSLEYTFNNTTAPFTLETLILEYATEERM